MGPWSTVAVEEKKARMVRNNNASLQVLKVVFGLIGAVIALVFVVGGVCTCYKIKVKNTTGLLVCFISS